MNWILGTSNYLSKNFVNFNIKHYGSSYPDVLEYKQDNVVDVKTYERLTGYDKNTGLSLDMPRYSTFKKNEWHYKIQDKIAGSKSTNSNPLDYMHCILILNIKLLPFTSPKLDTKTDEALW